MRKFSIRTMLIVVAIAAVAVWWLDSGFRVVHEEYHPKFGRFVIYAKRGKVPEEGHISGTMEMNGTPVSELEFKSLVDPVASVWCIYDTGDANFVLIALPEKAQTGGFGAFWHPGIHLGWGRGFWVNLYDEFRGAHPELPYRRLPSEFRFAPD